jgi:hypothetical protein
LSDEKAQKNMNTVSEEVQVMVNLKSDCLSFHECISASRRLLKSNYGNEKYEWPAKTLVPQSFAHPWDLL